MPFETNSDIAAALGLLVEAAAGVQPWPAETGKCVGRTSTG